MCTFQHLLNCTMRGAYLLWWYIECLQSCVDSFELVEAWEKEEHTRRLFPPILDATETEHNCTLVLIYHLKKKQNVA